MAIRDVMQFQMAAFGHFDGSVSVENRKHPKHR